MPQTLDWYTTKAAFTRYHAAGAEDTDKAEKVSGLLIVITTDR